ncbi:hypothetical protein N1F78_09610 [Seonamhaeicola sp. MEBiC1930]|uniref:hypothetical protein n=1 Tax=Seonamhaeicola sp. MEBiC01930 TaxID=2976768 RepID=UPI003243C539
MRNVKYLLLSICLFGHICLINGQENHKPESSFSFSIGLGYFGHMSPGIGYESVSFVDEPNKEPSMSLNGDLAFEIDKYIFSFYFTLGLVDPIPYKQDSYSEYNFTVGKEFFKKGRFAFEGHVGMGYFEQKERYAPDGQIEIYGTVGFPIRIKANFYLTNNIALGLNPNANINFDSSIMSLCLITKLRV